jgi:phage tail-like protein
MSAGQALASTVLGAYPSYGLAMRFEVTVDDLSLGLWQSCKGLQVELQYKKFDQGGQYTQQCVLPEKLVYGKITLERAVNKQDSPALQSWLRSYVTDWGVYIRRSGGAALSTQLTIELLDFQLNEVMSWTLYNARPSKWQGPSLGASDNKVAIETLEFEHEGFLYKAAEPS